MKLAIATRRADVARFDVLGGGVVDMPSSLR